MGISFLAPALLGGAALVAVPVVLHLVMRRKPVPHEFPAVRFLRERSVARRRRLRLSHLLLLLLRMAALMLLALALARPVLRGAGWLGDAEAPVAAAFVFDTAPRMALREGNRTRLEQAGEMARVLFGKLPPDSEVAVVDTTGSPAAFAASIAAAEARLGRLSPTTPGQPLASAVAAAARLLERSDKLRKEIYVFTDCSRGALEAGLPESLGGDGDGPRLLVIDVAAKAPRNFAIDSIALSGERITDGSPLGISVTVSRSGPEATRPVAVEILTPEGRFTRRGVKPVTFPAGATTTVDFEVGGLESGLRQGRVVIDGSDDLDPDNQRFFTVEVGAPAGVLVVAPAPAERTGMFVVQAIAPTPLVREGRARFAPTLVEFGRIEGVDWATIRGMVLVDPPPLSAEVWAGLERWVAAGRGLVVWLGPRAGSAEGFSSPAARRVIGGRLVRVWRSPSGENFLAPSALAHPLLAAFRRIGDEVPWQDFPVFRHWEFEPDASPSGDDGGTGATQVIASYRNGLPAVLEHRVGDGTVVVITTPVSQSADDPEAWNTLATGFEPWPFLMLANETLLHAMMPPTVHNVTAGAVAVVHLDRRDLVGTFVRTPSGDDFPAPVDPRRGSVSVSATQEPGNYLIRAGGQEGGVESGFSSNLAPAATDFQRLAAADLAAAIGPNVRLARTEAELVRDVQLERVGAELFGWIILLAAAAMAGDWIVANRFYAPRPEVAGQPAAEFADAIRDDRPHGGAGRAGGPDGPPPVTASSAARSDASSPVPPSPHEIGA
jgi:hypothetical protein